MDIGVVLDAWAHVVQGVILWIIARPFWLLVTLILLDILTGLIIGFRERRLSSKISREGMTRKVGFILAAAFGALIEPFVQGLVESPAIGKSIAWMLCAPEAFSIYENLKKLDVPLPLSGRFSRDDDDRKES